MEGVLSTFWGVNELLFRRQAGGQLVLEKGAEVLKHGQEAASGVARA